MPFLARLASLFALVLLVTACETPGYPTQFWRPISEPNIQLILEKQQEKLNFDLSQCVCGIFPRNIPRQNLIQYMPDQQRLAETSHLAPTQGDGWLWSGEGWLTTPATCEMRPSWIVSECMRGRGWETTECSGRIPVGAKGASVCSNWMLTSPEAAASGAARR